MEKFIKGFVLFVFECFYKEIKYKVKEFVYGVEKGVKEVEKVCNMIQKYIEFLGQYMVVFEFSGVKYYFNDDLYVIQWGVLYRLNKQVQEENNQCNDLIVVQVNFQEFEVYVIGMVQQVMEVFNSFVGGQVLKVQVLYVDMFGFVQRILFDFEWKGFVKRLGDKLVDLVEGFRIVEVIQFLNQNYVLIKVLIEGSLERKSRNKFSWGYFMGYYVVILVKFLYEFKDDDNYRKDLMLELSIYLLDVIIGLLVGEKFNVKGKDKSGGLGGKLLGSSELSFKVYSLVEVMKWFEVIKKVVGVMLGSLMVLSLVEEVKVNLVEVVVVFVMQGVIGVEEKLKLVVVVFEVSILVVVDVKVQEVGVVFVVVVFVVVFVVVDEKVVVKVQGDFQGGGFVGRRVVGSWVDGVGEEGVWSVEGYEDEEGYIMFLRE